VFCQFDNRALQFEKHEPKLGFACNEQHEYGLGADRVNDDIPLRRTNVDLLHLRAHEVRGNALADAEKGSRHTANQVFVDFRRQHRRYDKAVSRDHRRADNFGRTLTDGAQNFVQLFAFRCHGSSQRQVVAFKGHWRIRTELIRILL
jgi:hypothetical protein